MFIIVKYMYNQVIKVSHNTLDSSLSFIMSANTNLPPVIDASHTTPTTPVNQGPKLLKLVEETLSML